MGTSGRKKRREGRKGKGDEEKMLGMREKEGDMRTRGGMGGERQLEWVREGGEGWRGKENEGNYCPTDTYPRAQTVRADRAYMTYVAVQCRA